MMHARYGQTVGKRVTKIRVVQFPAEGKITFRQAWLREGITMLLYFGPLLIFGVFAIMTSGVDPNPSVIHVTEKTLGDSKTFWLLMLLPPLLWLAADVRMLIINDERRVLHDFIAGTVVIRTNIEKEYAEQKASEA